MVTRALCKTLSAAERQREQAVTNNNKTAELLLCFTEPTDILLAKQKLLSWSRDEQEDEYIRYKRCMDNFQSPSGTASHEGNRKKESTNTRSTKTNKTEVKIERGKQTSLPISTIKTWNEKYGVKMVNGSKIKLCWYHCNRQGGCRQLATCSNDHNTFPDKYNGKHYTDLTEAQRSDVVKTCQRL